MSADPGNRVPGLEQALPLEWRHRPKAPQLRCNATRHHQLTRPSQWRRDHHHQWEVLHSQEVPASPPLRSREQLQRVLHRKRRPSFPEDDKTET
eukprot:1735357-Amphidinium_carterae.1